MNKIIGSLSLVLCSPLLALHLVRDTALQVSSTEFNVVIEIPAGTNEKWEADKQTGELKHDIKNGKKRIVQYLAYPFNYGFFPQTLLDKKEGGDGDPLDVAVIGHTVERGTVLKVRPLGVLVMQDDAETDDKIIAVPVDSEIFKNLRTLQDLNKQFNGITSIMQLFFNNYKGPDAMIDHGWRDEVYARTLIKKAAQGFRKKNS